MIRAWSMFIGCLLLSTPAFASCEPYPSYVYDLQAIECHALDEQTVLAYWSGADLGSKVIVTWVYEDLARGPHAVVTAKVFSRIQVAICDWKGECKKSRGEEEVLGDVRRFHWQGTCDELMNSYGKQRYAYAVRPCCDVEPPKSVDCAVSLEELLERPYWLESIDD